MRVGETGIVLEVSLPPTLQTQTKALLHCLVQHSDHNLDERKAVMKVMARTLTEAVSNDMITAIDFTKGFSGLSKDRAPEPDKVRYSGIENLSEDDKSVLFKL